MIGLSLTPCCCDNQSYDLVRSHHQNAPIWMVEHYGPDVDSLASPNDFYMISPLIVGGDATGRTRNSQTDAIWSVDLDTFVLGPGVVMTYGATSGSGFVAGFDPAGNRVWIVDDDSSNLRTATGSPTEDYIEKALIAAGTQIKHNYFFGKMTAGTSTPVPRWNWEHFALGRSHGGRASEIGLFIPETETFEGTRIWSAGATTFSFGGGELIFYVPSDSQSPGPDNFSIVNKFTEGVANATHDRLTSEYVSAGITRNISDVIRIGFEGPGTGESVLSMVLLRHRLNKTCVAVESIFGGTMNTVDVNGETRYVINNPTVTKRFKVGLQVPGEFYGDNSTMIDCFDVQEPDPPSPPINYDDDFIYPSFISPKDAMNGNFRYRQGLYHPFVENNYYVGLLPDFEVRMFDASESADGTEVKSFALYSPNGIHYGGENFAVANIYTEAQCYKGVQTAGTPRYAGASWWDTFDDLKQWCADNSHPTINWDTNPPPANCWTEIGAEQVTSYDSSGLANVPWLEGPLVSMICPPDVQPPNTLDPNDADAIFMFTEIQFQNAVGLVPDIDNSIKRCRLDFWRRGVKFAVLYSSILQGNPNPFLYNEFGSSVFTLNPSQPRILTKTERFTYVKMPVPETTTPYVAIRNDASRFFECQAEDGLNPGKGNLLDIAFSNYPYGPEIERANKTLPSILLI